MAELEGGGHLRRERVEEGVEDVEVLLELRRQLKEERAEAIAERGGDVAEAAGEVGDVLQTACRA